MKLGSETNGDLVEPSKSPLPEIGTESLIAPSAPDDSSVNPERLVLPPPAYSWAVESPLLEENPIMPPPAETWGEPDLVSHLSSEPVPVADVVELVLPAPAESWTLCAPDSNEQETRITALEAPIAKSTDEVAVGAVSEKPVESVKPEVPPVSVEPPVAAVPALPPPVPDAAAESLTAPVTSGPFAAASEQTSDAVSNPFAKPEPVVESVVNEEETVEDADCPFAWQPFTFSGVAAFGRCSLIHLMVVQFLMAAFAGGALVLFVDRNYSPVVQEAVERMPESVVIRRGQLEGVSSGVLSERKSLSIAVDMDGTGQFGQSSDLQLELHRRNFSLCPMFRTFAGVMVVDYPTNQSVLLGRAFLEPWWGAWRPILYTGLFFGTVVGLMVTWMILATFYTLFVRLMAYYADRRITMGGSWRLAYAALMPGAAVMVAGILLYSRQWLDLIGLLILACGHLAVPWIYLLVSPFKLPRMGETKAGGNPFGFQ